MAEIHGAAKIFCRSQNGGQIEHFDEAVVDGQVPEAFKDTDQLQAIWGYGLR